MYKKFVYLIIIISLLMLRNTVRADFTITNGDFETGGSAGTTYDIPEWYDGNRYTTSYWNDTWVTDSVGITPNGSNVVVFSEYAGPTTDPLYAGSYLYQSIGNSSGEPSITISFDWGHPDDVGVGRHDALTVSVLASDGSFVADDATDVYGATGITLLDSASYDHVAEGTDGEIWTVEITLDLSGASAGDEIFLRFNNYRPEAGAAPWPVLDNVQITSVGPVEYGKASDPYPANKSTDILRDIILSWKPGENAVTHNIFFGTNLNDVNNATIDNPLNTIFFEGLALDANSFDPGSLEFNTTYYWRVDEIDTPTTYKGQVWSFTVEPVALKLPYENIVKVTAISNYTNNDPNYTINEYGLDPNNPDQHSKSFGSWASSGNDANGVWIQYDFDKQYKIHEMMVWNYNHVINKTYGFRKVLIEYSEDGSDTWIEITDVNEFNKATGKDDYVYNTVVPFNDAIVKSVRITASTNWGTKSFFGLSEIRFTYIPVRARKPSPDDETTNVSVERTLTWRTGREAVTHKVYIGTDEVAVTNGTASSCTASVSSYSPDLTLGSTYYWRVDEINNSMTPSVWEGDVWSFSTKSSILIEGFEKGYGNTATDAVYKTWKDGVELQDSTNGSYTGRPSPPYLHTINHSGGHSAPMKYQNDTHTYSEITADTSKLLNGSDWSIGNPESLMVWFRADANEVNEPALDRLYVKLNNANKKVYDGPASDIRRSAWMRWEIPLAGISLGNISSITIGVERIGSTGSIGILYFDDIMLTLASPEPVDPGTDNLVAKYDMENNLLDSSGSGYNGTGHGNLKYQAGKSGQALVFDGNDATYVELPIGELISTMESCTITTWCNWAGGNAWQRIFDFGSGTADNMFLTPRPMRFAIKADNSTEYQANASYNLAANNWEHLTIVINAEKSTITMYINGNVAATNTNLQILPINMGVTTNNWLGRSQYAVDPAFNGMLDDFRIYDRALSGGEVRYIYEN